MALIALVPELLPRSVMFVCRFTASRVWFFLFQYTGCHFQLRFFSGLRVDEHRFDQLWGVKSLYNVNISSTFPPVSCVVDPGEVGFPVTSSPARDSIKWDFVSQHQFLSLRRVLQSRRSPKDLNLSFLCQSPIHNQQRQRSTCPTVYVYTSNQNVH